MGSTLYQYLAVLCVNLCTIGYSTSVGWIGIQLINYDSDHSPLPTGRVPTHQLGWIASILGIGGLAGTVAGGWMADRFGRKISLLTLVLPEITSYLLIIFAENVYYLYVSRFFSGFVGGAVFVIIPLMVAEIAEDNIRGTLSTILVVSSSAGAVLGFLIAYLIPYGLGPWLCLAFPILFLISYSFMPETPYYLMKTNRMEDAEKSLRFYRNVSPKGSPKSFKIFEHELSKLKYEYTKMQRIDANPTENSPTKIADFVNRPFAICCILMVAHEVCGVFTMLNYASVIFKKAGSSLEPEMAAIIVGAIQLAGSYVSSLLIDNLGRKLLMAVSFAGTAICHCVMATYIYVAMSTDIDVKSFNWLPVVAFSAMIFIAGCGAMPIPYVIMAEILPNKIRNSGITMVSCISWICTFILAKFFPALMGIIQLWGCIYLFAISCVFTVVYILVAVPETKGKSLDEILLILNVK